MTLAEREKMSHYKKDKRSQALLALQKLLPLQLHGTPRVEGGGMAVPSTHPLTQLYPLRHFLGITAYECPLGLWRPCRHNIKLRMIAESFIYFYMIYFN